MLRALPRILEAHNVSMLREIVAAVCLVWYCIVVIVCSVGFTQLFRYYSKKPKPAACLSLPKDEIPHVTVIRPVKGLEPRLYECLASTFRQTYPINRLTVYFCVSSRDDPALPILQRLIRDFPQFDAKLFVEEDDPLLRPERRNGAGTEQRHLELGPNPKIRNMSRAYREAKGDLIWIIDCNVWVGKGVCGRLVDLLGGFGGKRPNKFVHQLPMVIDMDGESVSDADRKQLLDGEQQMDGDITAQSTRKQEKSKLKRIWQRGGGRLEEMFMSSSHAKFYTAINTVLLAPCIVGKSNMFRRSHLDYLTMTNPRRSPGIDFFSDNICEDHLIGDALWKKPQSFELGGSKTKIGDGSNGSGKAAAGGTTSTTSTPQKSVKFGKHAMLFGDMCFQPVSHTSIPAYIARRVRWLRVRKFTVTLATLVEPGTESILCSLYGAYAITTLPPFSKRFGIPCTWATFWVFFFCNMALWCLVDWTQYRLLHSAKSIELDADTPDFVLPPTSPSTRASAEHTSDPSRQPLLTKTKSGATSVSSGTRRTFAQWCVFWLGRELLAFPIWFWAVWGGVTVTWRGKKFWVGVDMKVHEIKTTTGIETK